MLCLIYQGVAQPKRNQYEFTDADVDANVESQFHHTRHYDPTVGQFISLDAAGCAPAADVNLCRYVHQGSRPD